MVIGGYIKPLKSKSAQRTELINEIIITFIFYTFLCFSELVPVPETRVIVGYFCCALVIVHFLANLGLISYLSLKAIRENQRRKKLKRIHKQRIAAGEIDKDPPKIRQKRKEII